MCSSRRTRGREEKELSRHAFARGFGLPIVHAISGSADHEVHEAPGKATT
jgi:hypothetical protein